MKVVGLVSGGKDSCYNLIECIKNGHEIICLANLHPKDKDELDSYMYQTVGHNAIEVYSEACDLPLYRQVIEGSPININMEYTPESKDEVEDLYKLLSIVKDKHPDIEGVSVGAIFSEYQKVRVENVCDRLSLTPLCYLWKREQSQLMKDMIESGLKAIIIKVAALGLEPSKHIGLKLNEIYPHLLLMNDKYGLNICGEGGEFETFVIDCCLFKKRIVIDHWDTVIHSKDAFAPVGYMKINKLHLEPKE